MSTFEWNGDSYPVPQGWEGLSIEDWFYKLESFRDRLMNIDDENLEPMQDEDGDDLDPEEVLLIQNGFQSGGHWECFRSWGVHGWALKSGVSDTDVEFRQGGIARERIIKEKGAKLSAGGGGLTPVEGVSVEAWAAVQAGVAGGKNLDALIAGAGLDRAKWDRVSAEWMGRMSTDTTGAIATAYGNAFSSGGSQYGGAAAHAANVGVGGDLSQEPIPYERYIEIQEAMGAASNRGEDAMAVLSDFGISIVDYTAIGTYWNKRTQQEATKYYELYTELSEKYRAKYAS